MSFRRLAVTVVPAFLGVLAPSLGLGFSTGVTTPSFPTPATGCNNVICHSGGSTPTVTLTGPTAVSPSSVNTYLVTVFSIGSQMHAGFNATASSGSVSVGGADSAMTQLLAGEMTHTGPKADVGGMILFSFDWTAPATPGSATLDAWGNAVNLNFITTGDAAAMDSLTVTVGTPPPVPAMPGPIAPVALALLMLGAATWYLTRRTAKAPVRR